MKSLVVAIVNSFKTFDELAEVKPNRRARRRTRIHGALIAPRSDDDFQRAADPGDTGRVSHILETANGAVAILTRASHGWVKIFGCDIGQLADRLRKEGISFGKV